MGYREDYISKMLPYAREASSILSTKGLTVDPSFIVAQWAHETGYGTNKGATRNNHAGIYAYPSSPYGLAGKQYSDLSDFVGDYVNVISQDRYTKYGVGSATSATDFAKALKAGGYATDPNYAYAGTWEQASKLAGGVTISTGKTSTSNFGGIGQDLEQMKESGVIADSYPTGGLFQQITDFVKLGAVQLMIFISVLLFLYFALVRGSTVDRLAKAVI